MMLSITDVPKHVEDMYTEAKGIAAELYEKVRKIGQEDRIGAKQDVLSQIGDDTIMFILEGFYKYYIGKKVIRLYSDSDFVFRDNTPQAKMISDFATTVVFFDKEEFMKKVKKDKNLSEMMIQLQELCAKINLSLAALYMGEEGEIDFSVRKFEKGSPIIKEGDSPHEVFEMIEGKAEVSVKGAKVGEIREGEIFGEISFLNESTRTATVLASTDCLVRSVRKDDFMEQMKINPKLIITIAKTLAGRVVLLNKKVQDGII